VTPLTPEERSDILLRNIDTSDCGVIALQAITSAGRAVCDAAAKEHANYRPGVGTPRGGLEKTLRRMGYRTQPVDPDPHDSVATFALRNEYGVFLIYTDKHVMALVEGDLHNSVGSWSRPIEAITLVKEKQR
jgi:hypothetical protein